MIVQGYHNKTMKNQQSIKYNAFRKLQQAFSSKWNAWNVVKMNSQKKKHVKHYIWSKYLNSYPWITIFYFLSKFLARRNFFLQTLELMNDIWCVETCWNTICTLRIGMYTEKYFFLQFYMHASMSAKCADMPRQFLD